MLANTLGIDFDPAKDYDERREIYQMSGKIVESWVHKPGRVGRRGQSLDDGPGSSLVCTIIPPGCPDLSVGKDGGLIADSWEKACRR